MFGYPLDLLALSLLILTNGLLSMVETAVVSARKTLLANHANEVGKTAVAVRSLVQNPARFLSFVHIWLTFSSMTAGVIGGACIATPVGKYLGQFAPEFLWITPAAYLITILGLTSLLVFVGELVPKRIALAYPETVAKLLAGSVVKLTVLASPILFLFESAIAFVVKTFGLRPSAAANVIDDDEVRALVEQGLHAGVFKPAEKDMVDSVLQLDDSPITDLMTPRPKIVFLNLDDPEEANWRKIVTSGHSYFPVYQSNRDQVVGLVSVKSLWAHSAIGLPTTLKNLLVSPLTVNEEQTAIQVLEQFKQTGKHIAIVTDEFGAVQGLVTLIDLLEAIVGDLPDQVEQHEEPTAHQREDGSWLIDATLSITELKEILEIEVDLPHENEADFQTLGGFVMTQFGRIPKAGNQFDWHNLRFEVVDMDRHRVDKVLITALAPIVENLDEESA